MSMICEWRDEMIMIWFNLISHKNIGTFCDRLRDSRVFHHTATARLGDVLQGRANLHLGNNGCRCSRHLFWHNVESSGEFADRCERERPSTDNHVVVRLSVDQRRKDIDIDSRCKIRKAETSCRWWFFSLAFTITHVKSDDFLLNFFLISLSQ